MQTEFGAFLFRWLLTLSGLFFITRSFTSVGLFFLFTPLWPILSLITGIWLIMEGWVPAVHGCQLKFIGASLVIWTVAWRVTALIIDGTSLAPFSLFELERIIAAASGWIVIGIYTALLSAFGWSRPKALPEGMLENSSS